MTEVIPAILEKNFTGIEKKIRSLEGLADWVQIDLLDNTLMPNSSFSDPAPFATLKTPLKLELHMMVKDPLRYLERYSQAGFKRFFAHIEGEYVDEYVNECYRLGVEAGLAVDGPTPFEKIRKYLDNIDCVLVMAIEAGFSGRPFREDTLEKIKKIREADLEIPIAVDGAMDDINGAKVVAAGATRINSNSYLFQSPNIEEAIKRLRNL